MLCFIPYLGYVCSSCMTSSQWTWAWVPQSPMWGVRQGIQPELQVVQAKWSSTSVTRVASTDIRALKFECDFACTHGSILLCFVVSRFTAVKLQTSFCQDSCECRPYSEFCTYHSVDPSIPSICLSICRSVHPSICRSILPSFHLSNLSIYLYTSVTSDTR